MTMTPEQKRAPRLVAIPTVPHGVEYMPVDQADAGYYRSAAANIRAYKKRGLKFSGSNVTEAIARLCEAAADALEATPDTPDENDRDVAYKIARLGAEHMPILGWGGGAAPEPMGEVCSKCGDEPCTFKAELDVLLPALSRAAVPEATEPESRRWFAACWRDENGNLEPLESETVVREYAEAGVMRWRDIESRNPDGQPDSVVLASRPVHPWLPVPERGEG